ncbi:MAG: hypothetical protein U5L02_00025 [Rheinheimera sp.]|nr:hypothetical protein [Rheinheimera sp.]
MSCHTQQQLEQLIEQRFTTLSNRLQLIGRFLLDQPEQVAFGTTASIAQGAGVHASALVRFANAFGFSGFSQMQQLFQQRLVQSGVDYPSRIAAVREDHSVAPDAAGFSYLQQISQANQQAMQQLCAEMDNVTLPVPRGCYNKRGSSTFRAHAGRFRLPVTPDIYWGTPAAPCRYWMVLVICSTVR